MKSLFGRLFLSFILIIALIIVSVLASFYLVYSESYEKQIVKENNLQAMYMGRSLYSFIASAYKEVEELAHNNDIISMETGQQTPIFMDAIKRNDFFELLYAQGMDGMQTGRSSGNLGNRKERWWFIKMEQLKQPFVSESYYSVGTNMPCASVFFPIMKGSEMAGIMAGDIKLSALQDLVVETADAGSWTFFLDSKGVVVAHPDKTYQEQLYNYAKLTKTITVKDAAGNPIKDAAGNLTEEQTFTISDEYKAAIADMMKGNINSAKFREEGKTIYLSYRPVQLAGSSDPWYVLSVKDGSIVMQTRNKLIMVILCSTAIIALLALLIVFLVARNISVPIKEVHLALKKMKDGDFTGRVTVKSQDELGKMIQLLNQTRDGVGRLIVSIKKEAESLLRIGNDLASDMQTTAGAINEITANIQSVKEKVVTQSTSVFETKSTMEQVSVNIDKLGKNVDIQTNSVSQSSSAIEEMLANVQSVTQSLIRNADSVEELIKVSDEGRSSLQKVSQDIQEIARESEGLLEINTVMENIASQTNLLSMNAAIEAAHAGEAGKGFAVVADEIRKLATSSGEQSKTISSVLKKIKTAIDTITVSANLVMEKFHAIEERVRTVSEQEANIRNAMEEQGQGSQQILEAVANLNDLTNKVKQGSLEMFEGSKEVISESQHLEKTTEEISGDMNEMAGGADEMNSAVKHINEISKSNRDYISSLFTEISKFKVD